MWILQLSFPWLHFNSLYTTQFFNRLRVKSTVDFIKTKLETSVMEFYQERFSSPQRVESIDSGTAFIWNTIEPILWKLDKRVSFKVHASVGRGLRTECVKC